MCQADALPEPSLLMGQRVVLEPHFSAMEDADGSLSVNYLFDHTVAFVPLSALQRGSPTGYYWLRTILLADSEMLDPVQVLSFSHLTYVDIYLYEGNSLILHKQAGAFRKRSDIGEEDGRLYTHLPLERGKAYTLLLRVHHTKHYQPVFDFALQSRRGYFRNLRLKEATDAALQGAIGLFFLYTLLSWIVSRFRPYLWLLFFIAGSGLFVISSTGYFIEWFFPEDPPTGWLFNVHFLYLGLFGLNRLLADFWQLKKYNPGLYRMRQLANLLLAV
ncbi:MAG TPA: 7TM diverse intracellular signaling domain-containing protein, partial [Puia sp.]|nr:7TM diverse intracellular signaling domain-containing protein [Puia sp.]